MRTDGVEREESANEVAPRVRPDTRLNRPSDDPDVAAVVLDPGVATKTTP